MPETAQHIEFNDDRPGKRANFLWPVLFPYRERYLTRQKQETQHSVQTARQNASGILQEDSARIEAGS